VSGWQGIPLDRVVAVVASLVNGLEQVGSGYLVGGRLVLTAEHCTRDKRTGQPPQSLRVIRASDGRPAAATVRVASPEVDVAVLDVSDGPWPPDLPAPRFGRVDRARSGELTGCEAIGYPLWQFDPTDQQRSTAELHGTIRKTEDFESSHLLLRDPLLMTVAAPPITVGVDDADRASPWGGLSGALVFHSGVALGIVVQHHPRQGASAVRLVPIDRIATGRDDKTRAVAVALGLPSVDLLPLVEAAQSVLPLEGLVDWLVDGDLPRAGNLDPYRLGATPSIYGGSSSYGYFDAYVPRRVDDALRAALQPGRLVLLVGPSKAGKTRTAFEALGAHWAQARLVVPVVGALGRLAAHPRLGSSAEPMVVWLDDVHRYLAGTDRLTPGLLARFTARPGRTVILATLRREERDRLRGGAVELSRDVRNLLDAATTIELTSTADDPEEQAAARAVYPAEDLSSAGLAERLAHAPALLQAYRDAAVADPLRYILVRIAVDWARVGMVSPIPEGDLLDLARAALWDERPDLDPDEQQVARALAWARAPLSASGRVAALVTYPLPGRVRGYSPFSYLVAADDGQTGPPRSIPGPFWEQVLKRVTPEDAFAVGVSAENRGNTPVAIAASRIAVDAGYIDAMHNLAVLLEKLDPPDLDGARYWYQTAADAGLTDAMNNLGVLLRKLDPPDLDGARRWFQTAADAGLTDAMNNLGVLLRDLDPPDPDGARRWFQTAADAGLTGAMVNLGALLYELDPPDLDGARFWYRKAADAGDPGAMNNLGLLLQWQDPPDLAGAWHWLQKAANAGDTGAMNSFGVLLAVLDPPDLDGARRWYQQAAASGDPDAMINLSSVLAVEGDLERCRVLLQKAADAGRPEARYYASALNDNPAIRNAAIADLRGLDLDNDTDALNFLGLAALRAGRRNEARALWIRSRDADDGVAALLLNSSGLG
jgi:TPR repeat protein